MTAPALSRQRQGGLGLTVAGAPVVCRPSGALWLEACAALIVADLHLEKGSAFAARGQLLPPYDTGDTLGRLEAEVAALAPAMIVLLGDSFHDGQGEDRLAAADARRLGELAAGRRLVWLAGNHDLGAPRGLAGEAARSIRLAGLDLVHQPSPLPVAAEAAGHLHPCAKVRGRAGKVRRRCFATDGERIVLPAFGAYAGGLNIRDAAFRGLFARPPLAVVLGAGVAQPVKWALLGAD